MNLNEIAYRLKTLPRFVSSRIDTNEHFDWYSLIVNRSEELSFSQIVQQFTGPVELRRELEEIYIACKWREIKNIPSMKQVILWELEQQFGSLKYQTSKILSHIDNEIKIFLAKIKKTLHNELLLVNLVESTPVLVESTTFIINLTCDLTEFFNVCTLSDTIPMIVYKNVIKIKPGYINTSIVKENFFDSFALYYKNNWIIFDNEKNCKYIIKHSEKNHMNLKSFIDDLKYHYINFNYTLLSSLIQTTFYFPNLDLCETSFLDVIMMDFSETVVCDEKTFSNRKWHTLKFISENIININVSIKKCKTIKLAKKFGVDLFSINSVYVKCTSSAVKHPELLEIAKTKLSKIIYLSQSIKDEILPFYQSILGKDTNYTKFNDETTDYTVSNTKRLKQIMPTLFITDYPRKCLHLPRILESHEDKTNAIQFPIYGEHSKSKWYGCDHYTDAIYPGLRKNPLSNSEIFPYIPCCYLSDQKEKIGSGYRKYYFQEDVKRIKRIPDSVIFSTNRIVPFGVFGELPKQLKTYFYDSNCFEDFFRFGVNHCTYSIIKCLELATKKTFSNNIDETVFYDPIENHYMLEHYFNINIILFENNKGNSNFVNMNKTNFLKPMFSWKKEIVLILINKGLIADNAKYPQCEIFCRGTVPKFLFTKKEIKKLLYLHDEYNYIYRVKPLKNVILQYTIDNTYVYKVKLNDETFIECDPFHPLYIDVPFANIEKNNCKNPVFLFEKNYKLFEIELKKAVNNESNNIKFVTFSKSLSKNTKKKISMNNNYTVEYVNNDKQMIFSCYDSYIKYIKNQDIFYFHDCRIQKKCCILKNCDESILQQLTHYKLYAISLINKKYFKVFYKPGDGFQTRIVKIDNKWYTLTSKNDER
jgi:hypothetical protein